MPLEGEVPLKEGRKCITCKSSGYETFFLVLSYCAVADNDGGDMGATLLPQHITFPVPCLSVTMNIGGDSGGAAILYLIRCPLSLPSLRCIVIYYYYF